jgi:hypothetical protein
MTCWAAVAAATAPRRMTTDEDDAAEILVSDGSYRYLHVTLVQAVWSGSNFWNKSEETKHTSSLAAEPRSRTV